MLTLQLELMEQRWAANEDEVVSPQALDAYQRMTGALRRVLESLGLKRRARDVAPSLGEIIRQGQREAAER